MLVTLSGLPGSGTSTVARAVAADLRLDHLDGGTVFRTMAAERSLSLAAFAALAEDDDQIDRALDARLLARAAAGDVLVESRLAGWLAHANGLAGLRVWLSCEDRERARRVAARDHQDLADAERANAEREASERGRYLTYYGIDLADLGIYDLVVDSTDAAPDALVAQVTAAALARSDPR